MSNRVMVGPGAGVTGTIMPNDHVESTIQAEIDEVQGVLRTAQNDVARVLGRSVEDVEVQAVFRRWPV